LIAMKSKRNVKGERQKKKAKEGRPRNGRHRTQYGASTTGIPARRTALERSGELGLKGKTRTS